MKKIITTMIMMMATGLALAGVNDSVFSFATQGDDRYADGKIVEDGECYALVWAAAGSEFQGFCADGSLVDAENNRVVLVAPVARKGHCPKTVVEINDEFVKELGKGSFAVVLLDTRIQGVDGSVKLAGLDENGMPKYIAAVGEVLADVKVDNGFADAKALDAKTANGEVVLPSGSGAPQITEFSVQNGIASITFNGVSSYARYNVKGGATVDAVDGDVFSYDFNGEPDADGEMTINFAVEKVAGCKFFKIVRR